MSGRINKFQLLSSLPPVWPAETRRLLKNALHSSDRKLVVLDDDPTGTQTVYDIPVLTTWSVEDLAREFNSDFPGFYLLTNSRAHSSDQAAAINQDIANNLLLAAGREHSFTVISRGDSTLRGHFPSEVDALGYALMNGGSSGCANDRAHLPPEVLIPFFEAGGRFTINNVHYVAEGDDLIPAAETPFARDATFGYQNSDLRAWVQEKTLGAVPAGSVKTISLSELREGGPEVVLAKFSSLQNGDVCIVNAADKQDLDVVAWASFQAETAGKALLYRTAASFVAARLAQEARPLWSPAPNGLRTGGLIVVGSYVPRTTAQLEHLLQVTGIEKVELPVLKLLNHQRTKVLGEALATIQEKLAEGHDVVACTSRQFISGSDPHDCLKICAQISTALVELVQGLQLQPRYLIAKGGITSSDLATRALGVKRAMVLGQILPGVPVWELGAESKYPKITYVVFPGNVGGFEALTEAVSKFALTNKHL